MKKSEILEFKQTVVRPKRFGVFHFRKLPPSISTSYTNLAFPCCCTFPRAELWFKAVLCGKGIAELAETIPRRLILQPALRCQEVSCTASPWPLEVPLSPVLSLPHQQIHPSIPKGCPRVLSKGDLSLKYRESEFYNSFQGCKLNHEGA